jgi:hypothetical protein
MREGRNDLAEHLSQFLVLKVAVKERSGMVDSPYFNRISGLFFQPLGFQFGLVGAFDDEGIRQVIGEAESFAFMVRKIHRDRKFGDNEYEAHFVEVLQVVRECSNTLQVS